MAKHNQHIIARQVIELGVPSVTRAPEIQEAVAQRLRDHAMTELEKLFDRLGPSDRVVRLDRLEIDLGELGGADWQEHFDSRLVIQLAESLKKATTMWREQSTGAASGDGTPFEQYLYFLQHGRLPWWGETPSADWPQRLLQGLSSPQWQTLGNVLAHTEHARQRMIHAVDDSLLSTLLSQHAGLYGILDVFSLWRPSTLPLTQHTSWRIQFWLAVLTPAITTGQPSRGIEIMRRLLRLRHAFIADVSPRHGQVTHDIHAIPPLQEPWRSWLATALRDAETSGPFSVGRAKPEPSPGGDISPQTSETTTGSTSAQTELLLSQGTPRLPFVTDSLDDKTNVSRNVIGLTHATTPRSGVPDDDINTQAAPYEDNKSDHASSSIASPSNLDFAASRNGAKPVLGDEAIYLNGAGCIILHPFLDKLFRSNDLLDGRNFFDEASRGRAVHLLAKLTFGNEAIPEYELLLPKLLCGMTWEEPLEPVELSDKEHASCDELLHAVLRHWNVLKSNSIDWMREQFFLRSAKLEQLDSNWRLTVERRAQDVLLDRLPWGLGIIDTPWMQGRIYVHWMK